MTENARKIIIAVIDDLDHHHPEKHLLEHMLIVKFKEKGWEKLAEHYKKLIIEELNKDGNEEK